MVLLFWCWITRVVLEKRPLNECSSSNSSKLHSFLWAIVLYHIVGANGSLGHFQSSQPAFDWQNYMTCCYECSIVILGLVHVISHASQLCRSHGGHFSLSLSWNDHHDSCGCTVAVLNKKYLNVARVLAHSGMPVHHLSVENKLNVRWISSKYAFLPYLYFCHNLKITKYAFQSRPGFFGALCTCALIKHTVVAHEYEDDWLLGVSGTYIDRWSRTSYCLWCFEIMLLKHQQWSQNA